MATTKVEQRHAGRSFKDLTPYQWHAARLLSETKGPKDLLASDDVIDVAQSSADAVGVIFYPGHVAGERTTIDVLGRTKLKMSGTGKAFDSVKVTTDGKGAKANPDELAFAQALADWADGDVCPILLDKHTAQQPSPEPAGTTGGAGSPIVLQPGVAVAVNGDTQYQLAFGGVVRMTVEYKDPANTGYGFIEVIPPNGTAHTQVTLNSPATINSPADGLWVFKPNFTGAYPGKATLTVTVE